MTGTFERTGSSVATIGTRVIVRDTYRNAGMLGTVTETVWSGTCQMHNVSLDNGEQMCEESWKFERINEIATQPEKPQVFKKGTTFVSITGERGTVLRKCRGEQRYECEMADGTITYFYNTEMYTPAEWDAATQPETATIDDEIEITTPEGFSLAKLLWGDLPNLEARREWELDRDQLLSELRTAEREVSTLMQSESAYKLTRDSYFLSLARTHRNVSRKASALAAHYADQPVS